jgi:hypothetical protein
VVRVVYGLPEGGGWHPITHMVRLLAELLEAELVVVPLRRPANAWRRLTGLGPRRRGRGTCLVVAAEPRHLNTMLDRAYWLRGYEQVAGWVVDSFWVDRIPHSVRHRDHFDRLFVTDKEVVDEWSAATGAPVAWLPWGSDVLGHGSGAAERPVDLQRVGRQPASWEDDERTRRACEAAGIRFEGRPRIEADATANVALLMGALSRSKFALAFSNAASPAPYTHPSREYLTGRWTDSLASGAVVAGIAPRSAATTELLWPGATLELETTVLEEGIEQVADAVRGWSPELAAANHRQALRRLDWRWRFQALAAAVGVESDRLASDIERMEARLA